MLTRLYSGTMSLADHPRALWVLAVVAFVESSFFPIPPDILMIPMIIAAPAKAFRIAFVATLSSVLGGVFGYAIGAFAYDSLGAPILTALGKEAYFEAFAARYNAWGIWVVLVAGVTPFPYKVITILSGATSLPLGVFIATSVLARGLRFFIVAGLLWKFGPPVRSFIERHLGLAFTAFVVLLLCGFLVVGYL